MNTKYQDYKSTTEAILYLDYNYICYVTIKKTRKINMINKISNKQLIEN